MPLLKGKKNIGRNIRTEMAHGKQQKQAIAIAMNVAGISKHSKIHPQSGMKSHNHPAYKK